MSNQKQQIKFSPELCGIAQVAQILGDKWILLILREAFYGVTKFEDFRKNILIPKQTLSNRLSDLVEHGFFEHSVYKAEGKREHKEYLLTHKGKSLNIVLLAMLDWGASHLIKDTPKVKIFDKTTHALAHIGLFDHEGKIVTLDNIRLEIENPKNE